MGKFTVSEEEEGGRLFIDVSEIHSEDEEEEEEGSAAKRRRLRGPRKSGRLPVRYGYKMSAFPQKYHNYLSNFRCRRKGSSLQVHCPSLLSRLKSFIPSDGLCLVALTMLDLYEAAPDLFLAGLASGMERVALFSFARYDPCLEFSPEFWWEAKTKRSSIPDDLRRRLVLGRSCKLLVHETGHLLGLPHCVYYSCCMNGSGHLAEDFAQSAFLCPVCLRKLAMIAGTPGLDVRGRYEALGRIFRDFGMEEEEGWIRRRIEAGGADGDSN